MCMLQLYDWTVPYNAIDTWAHNRLRNSLNEQLQRQYDAILIKTAAEYAWHTTMLNPVIGNPLLVVPL